MRKEDKKRFLLWAIAAVVFIVLMDLFVIKTVSRLLPEEESPGAAAVEHMQQEDGTQDPDAQDIR